MYVPGQASPDTVPLLPRPVRAFDFDKRDEGVAAWKKDRTAVQRVRDNGLAVKVK